MTRAPGRGAGCLGLAFVAVAVPGAAAIAVGGHQVGGVGKFADTPTAAVMNADEVAGTVIDVAHQGQGNAGRRVLPVDAFESDAGLLLPAGLGIVAGAGRETRQGFSLCQRLQSPPVFLLPGSGGLGVKAGVVKTVAPACAVRDEAGQVTGQVDPVSGFALLLPFERQGALFWRQVFGVQDLLFAADKIASCNQTPVSSFSRGEVPEDAPVAVAGDDVIVRSGPGDRNMMPLGLAVPGRKGGSVLCGYGYNRGVGMGGTRRGQGSAGHRDGGTGL